MKARKNTESPNKAVSDILSNSKKPLVAYEILDMLKGQGINAPPTVYRALDKLVKTGVAHRIASNHSYFMCSHDIAHSNEAVVFAVCNGCNMVDEIADSQLGTLLQNIKTRTGFKAEHQVIEMTGLCQSCNSIPEGA